jgi:hypothetical protein
MKKGPQRNHIALYRWDTVSGRTNSLPTDAIERPAHATVGNGGKTIAFDSDEVWPR